VSMWGEQKGHYKERLRERREREGSREALLAPPPHQQQVVGLRQQLDNLDLYLHKAEALQKGNQFLVTALLPILYYGVWWKAKKGAKPPETSLRN
jgi:hypothetical protein